MEPQPTGYLETVNAFDAARSVNDRDRATALGAALLEGWPGEGALMYHVGIGLLAYGAGTVAHDALRAAAARPDARPEWHLHFAVCNRLSGAPEEALAHIDRALAIDPALAAAWAERGLIMVLRDDLAAAAEAYDRAEALGSSSLALHVNRSVVAFRLADGAGALRHARAAVAIDPASLAAQINAATMEGPLLGYEAALARLDAAAALGTGDAGYHRSRGHVFFKLERYADTLAEAERAIAADPAHPSGHELRVRGLIGLGRHAEAFAALDAAATIADGGLLRVNHAMLDLELGNRERARETLRAVVAEHPAIGVAWYTLGELDDLGDPAEIDSMEILLATEPALRNANDRLLMHHALGKAHLTHGRHDRAFEHYAVANALKRAVVGYDVAHDEQIMRSLAQEFSAARLAQPLPGTNPSERPVFIVGMPRSGTSLVEQILASHPAVFGAGEARAMPLIFAQRMQLPESDWPQLAQRYLNEVGTRAAGAARIVDKLPGNFAQIGFIRMLFPNARIIHLRRDALDNGLSIFVTLFDHGHQYSYDLREIGRFYRAYAGLMEHWRALVPATAMLEIDYETIVEDFETSARRLIAFIGLEWDDAVLRFYETRRAVRTASRVQVRRPIYRSSAGRATAFGAALDPLRAALAAGPPPEPGG